MTSDDAPKGELILYQTEDGRTRIECRFEGESRLYTRRARAFQILHEVYAELFEEDVS